MVKLNLIVYFVICTVSGETAGIAVAGITAVSTAAAGTAVAGIVAAGTAAVGSTTLGNDGTGLGGCFLEHCDPFIGSKLNATPTTSSSFPSFFCGYQNRACFGIL